MSASSAESSRRVPLPLGTLFAGRYRMERVLGEGSHSVVYAARDEAPDSKAAEIALKVIHRHLTGDAQVRQRFEREAKILARLEGEHVVRMLDFVEDAGLYAIVLERIDGPSLEAMLAEGAPLPIDVAIEVTLQVCAALGAAHANGIVHRDLKTANVLVERRAREGAPRAVRVKVVDFGLSRALQGESTERLTEQGMIFGTAEYMAPEQARGDEVDARADLYAAGVMLYEMTVGAPPFSCKTAVQTMTAHLREAPPAPRSARAGARITPALEAVILRALEKSPEDRFASARELATAIASVRDATTTVVHAPLGAASMEDIAGSDTDLHVEERGSFASAVTLRAEELAAARPTEEPVRVKVTPVPTPMVIVDEPTAVSGEPLPRTGKGRILWVIVALVAATVGVVLGVLMGTR